MIHVTLSFRGEPDEPTALRQAQGERIPRRNYEMGQLIQTRFITFTIGALVGRMVPHSLS